MRMRFQFDYGQVPSPEIRKQLTAICTPAPTYSKRKDGTEEIESYHNHSADIREIYRVWPDASIKVVGTPDEVTAWEALCDRLLSLENRVIQVVGAGQSYNARCNVHVPGLGLLMLNEVSVVPSACTEDVQDRLNEGWRIVAVCPQPDQRRPDYILGRTSTTESA